MAQGMMVLGSCQGFEEPLRLLKSHGLGGLGIEVEGIQDWGAFCCWPWQVGLGRVSKWEILYLRVRGSGERSRLVGNVCGFVWSMCGS